MMTNKEKRISKDIKNLSKNDFDNNNNIYNKNKNNNDKNYIEKYNENNFEISNSIFHGIQKNF